MPYLCIKWLISVLGLKPNLFFRLPDFSFLPCQMFYSRSQVPVPDDSKRGSLCVLGAQSDDVYLHSKNTKNITFVSLTRAASRAVVFSQRCEEDQW